LIRDIINKQYVLLDGSMGTMLQEQKVIKNELPSLVCNTDLERVVSIHKGYLDAGAKIITSNTFSINSKKLGSKVLLEKTIINAIKAAKMAASDYEDVYVAYNVGPLGEMLKPYGTLSFDKAYLLYQEQVKIAISQGVDLFIVETFSDLLEIKAAILAIKEHSELPIFATMSFEENQRTYSGTDPETMAVTLEGLGVDALGVNCSLGPDLLIDIVKRISNITNIPIIAQPNAGLPILVDGETRFNLRPDLYAQQMKLIIEAGASIVGGCCGTTEKHIAKLKDVVSNTVFIKQVSEPVTAASSGVKTVLFDEDLVIIGERINPTGKKDLQAALNNEDYDYVVKEAIKQVEEGSDILDINLSVAKIDEKMLFDNIIEDIQAVVDVPLQFDSSQPEVFEKSLRTYNGKPIINSVNGKQDSMDSIFPIAKKYGALVIGLTLDENGLPNTAEERLSIAMKIVNNAAKHGLNKKDIIIDCLTLTASAQQDQVKETLKGIRLIKEKLKVKTTLGISNISFGLPNRELINQVFLIQAIQSGLDSAILNSGDVKLMSAIYANNVLQGIDKNAQIYIDKVSDIKIEQIKNDDISLPYAVFRGLKDIAISITKDLVKEVSPLDIIDKYLLPALDRIGKAYEEEEIFLPQLIQSAEAAKGAFSVINKELSSSHVHKKDKIVLATVEGDIHDIGKNIVKVLLENYSYNVVDLGKDVSAEAILKSCQANEVMLLGLSALMTSTVESMKKTIELLKAKMPAIKIMVGGAVLTREYAREIGADYYAKDAQGAVRIANEVFK